MKDIGKRLGSGLIGIALLIFIVHKGGYILSFSVYLLSILGLREFYKAVENLKIKPNYFAGYLGTTVLFIDNLFEKNYFHLIITAIVLIFLLLLIFKKKTTIQDISITLLGIFYIPIMFFHIMYFENSKYIWLIFIISFGTDTFAYLSGNLFGKHKLCPSISPNKTIEGSLGGIVGCIILVILYSKYFNLEPVWSMVLLSIFSSILAQLGDLVASKIKRLTGIKDFGFIMPGHGGVLDRFDSIIFTAPLIYYFISSFIY